MNSTTKERRFEIVRNGRRCFWVWDSYRKLIFASFTDRDMAEAKRQQVERLHREGKIGVGRVTDYPL